MSLPRGAVAQVVYQYVTVAFHGHTLLLFDLDLFYGSVNFGRHCI